ncbi:MAG: SCO family protein [Bacteroidia bacterium]
MPLVFTIGYFYSKKEKEPVRLLAYFGPKNPLKVNDTTYHTVPAFFFTDQSGNKVTEQTVSGKIYVTDFFFTTCRSICPVMSTGLERVYKKFNNRNDVLILSHTVDPETDSTAQLMAYAKLHGVHDSKWLFLTGDKKHLYSIARKGYLLNAEAGDGGEDDFIHTQNFALIDKERHIRGFYDGTDSIEVARLMIDMQLLLDEYAWKEKK